MQQKFNVVFLGSNSVGKTSIIEKITSKTPDFSDDNQIASCLYQLPNKEIVMYDTKDIAELSNDLNSIEFQICFFVFNVNDVKSFEAIEKNAAKFKKENTLNILVGNMIDLGCIIDKNRVENLKKAGMFYYEISTKTNEKIDNISKLIQETDIYDKFYSNFFIKELQTDFNYNEFKKDISQNTRTIIYTQDNKFSPNLIMISFRSKQTKNFVFMKIQEFSKKPFLKLNVIPIKNDSADTYLNKTFYFVNIFGTFNVFKEFLASFDINNHDVEDLFDVQQTKNPMVFDVSPKNNYYSKIILEFMPYIKFQNKKIIFSDKSLDLPIIIISNLPSDFSESEIPFFKCKYEQVNRMFFNETGIKKYMSIQFKNNDDANNAIQYFNGARVDENEISAFHFIDSDLNKELIEYQVVVKNMVGSAFDLYHYFKEYGEIHRAIITNIDSMKTIGFVHFYDRESSLNAISSIREKETTLEVGFFSEFEIHAFNLHPSITEDDIKSIFKGTEKISIKKALSKTQLPSATIIFETIEAAKRASKLSSPHFKNLQIFCYYNIGYETAKNNFIKMKTDIHSDGKTLHLINSKSYHPQYIIDSLICSNDNTIVIKYFSYSTDYYISFETYNLCDFIKEQINQFTCDTGISADVVKNY